MNYRISAYGEQFLEKIRLITISVFLGLLSGCGFMQPDNLHMISALELNSVMQQQDIVLIDVHVPEQKHLAGTDLFAPFYQIDDYVSSLPADKNTALYLYCKSGPMANWAARTLFDLGYTNIYNLKGGLEAWEAAHLAVERHQ